MDAGAFSPMRSGKIWNCVITTLILCATLSSVQWFIGRGKIWKAMSWRENR